MANRYFLPALPQPGRHALPEAVAHHIARVLRMGVGEEVILGDGRGGTARAVVAVLGKKEILVDVADAEQAPPPDVTLTLAFAVPRLQRVEWLLEHGTEVGVACFQPIWTRRTRPTDERPDRWQRIVTAAAGQCDRAHLPSVAPASSLADLLAAPTLPPVRILADVDGRAGAPLAAGRAILLVGPEGGFAPEERQAIAAAGFTGMRLGRHILRTETAALVGAAALLAG